MEEIKKLEDLDKEKEQGISYKIDKITDKIYLASLEGIKENDYFKKENINSILSITNDLPKSDLDKSINHKIIDIGDLYSENIIKYFK